MKRYVLTMTEDQLAVALGFASSDELHRDFKTVEEAVRVIWSDFIKIEPQQEHQEIKPGEVGSLDAILEGELPNEMTQEFRDVSITSTFTHREAQGPFHQFSFETDGSRAMMYEKLCRAIHEADPAAIQWLMDKVAHIEQAQSDKITNLEA